MTIHELLAKFELRDLRVQFLHEAMTNIHTTKKGAKVTFATTSLTPNDLVAGKEPVGVIVWVDREAWNKIREAWNKIKE